MRTVGIGRGGDLRFAGGKEEEKRRKRGHSQSCSARDLLAGGGKRRKRGHSTFCRLSTADRGDGGSILVLIWSPRGGSKFGCRKRFRPDFRKPSLTRRDQVPRGGGKNVLEYTFRGLDGHLVLCTIVSIRAGENPAWSLTIWMDVVRNEGGGARGEGMKKDLKFEI